MFEAALASLRPRRRASIALSTGLHAFLCGALVLPPMLRMPELAEEPPDKVPEFVDLTDKAPKKDVVRETPPPPAAALAGAKTNVSVVTVPTKIPESVPKPLGENEREAPEVIGTVPHKADVVNDDPPIIVAPPEETGTGNVLPANAPGVTAPVALATPGPDYPELMRRAGIEGTVILEAVIDRTGRVTDVRVLRSVNPVLDRAATESVLKWRYEPARVGTHPVAVYLTVTLNFRLNR